MRGEAVRFFIWGMWSKSGHEILRRGGRERDQKEGGGLRFVT